MRFGRIVERQGDIVERLGERVERLGQRIEDLAEAQKQTDTRLNALIDVVERYFSDGRR
jgi:chaperonin cofactor prefoldin